VPSQAAFHGPFSDAALIFAALDPRKPGA
jgi:hypothetical protein